jgi:predicted ATPase with chaperone activity
MNTLTQPLQPLTVRRLTTGPNNHTGPLQPLSNAALSPLQRLLIEPATVEETGLPMSFLARLTLKILYFGGTLTGSEVATDLHLRFRGVVDAILAELKQHNLVEVKGGDHRNPGTYQYTLTDRGTQQANEALDRNRYVGPCPVALERYSEVIIAQGVQRPQVSEAEVNQATKGLILSEETKECIGPAVNSFKSLFLYGPPGNGKSSIAKIIGRNLLGGRVLVPHAIFTEGQVIKVFDAATHKALDAMDDPFQNQVKLDQRWVHCEPPVVIVGGELTLHDLDLAYNDTARYYEAPLQLKANGGMFLIDDFGRQQMQPKDLLNRWIVPLEERVDFLTFHTGKKIEIPFETLIVFSTNLDPETLMDEAFLRRIRHKLGVDYPSGRQFYQIFRLVCKQRKIPFEEGTFRYLVEKYYLATKRPFQASHPRDLLDQLTDFAVYRREPVRMTKDLMERAARSYFARLF